MPGPDEFNALVKVLQAIDLTQSILNRMAHNPEYQWSNRNEEIRGMLRRLNEELFFDLESLITTLFEDDED